MCIQTTPPELVSLASSYYLNTAQKMKFPLRISSVNVTKSAKTTDLVTFTEEILNEKLHFSCSERCAKQFHHFQFLMYI